VAQSLRLSQGTVHGYIARARRAGVGWPLPEGLDDIQLEALLFPPPSAVAAEQRPMPDWAVVHRELRRPNVTLSLLWEEYRGGAGAQDGFGYSWFCDLYREWVGRLKPTLRQVHTAGERIFVDFAGHAMEVIDGATGEIRRAEVFVAVLGASSYTFAEATWTQSLPDWIAVHVNTLAFIGGVPRRIVSDNLRAGITRACFYEPLVNRTYADIYVARRENVIAVGNSGTGKTHVALGLGLAACQKGLSVGFTTAAAVVHELIEARDDKRLLRLQRQLAGYKLLVIDELGYVPLSQTGAELLFEVFSQRYERGSTIVTSNLPFDEWTDVFASERLTGALLNRLTHHVHILEMNGDSYRLKQSKRRQRGARSVETPDTASEG
jgi:transposase